MILTITPFRPIHAELLFAGGVQPSQVSLPSATGLVVASLPGCALTAYAEGRVIACGGVVPFAPWLGTLWAILAKDAGAHMVELHRAVGRFIAAQPYRRLEASVPKGFTAGCRWMLLLGFRKEGLMAGYGESGEDHVRYGRIRRL
jgi:hypothetical protein